jgi:hypothetical protein
VSAQQVTTLANGLRVVTDRMDGVSTSTLGVWVDVGTRSEPEAVNGVAHLLEHMAFKGTARRSARDIAEEIETVGGQINAYTSREHTAYHARVLAEDVPLAIDILADILQQDTPDDVIFDNFQEQAFPEQGLGRPVLGRAEIIRTIERGAIAGYMARHYTPSRMVLSAAGAVDHGAVVKLAEDAFGALDGIAEAGPDAARYVGGDRREARRQLCRSRLLRGLGAVGAARRRHVVPPVPGNPREARPGLFGLFLRRLVHGWRAVRHLRRHRRGGGGRADPGDVRRAGGRGRHAGRGRVAARPGAAQGRAADGAGKQFVRRPASC